MLRLWLLLEGHIRSIFTGYAFYYRKKLTCTNDFPAYLRRHQTPGFYRVQLREPCAKGCCRYWYWFSFRQCNHSFPDWQCWPLWVQKYPNVLGCTDSRNYRVLALSHRLAFGSVSCLVVWLIATTILWHSLPSGFAIVFAEDTPDIAAANPTPGRIFLVGKYRLELNECDAHRWLGPIVPYLRRFDYCSARRRRRPHRLNCEDWTPSMSFFANTIVSLLHGLGFFWRTCIDSRMCTV